MKRKNDTFSVNQTGPKVVYFAIQKIEKQKSLGYVW